MHVFVAIVEIFANGLYLLKSQNRKSSIKIVLISTIWFETTLFRRIAIVQKILFAISLLSLGGFGIGTGLGDLIGPFLREDDRLLRPLGGFD